MKCFFIYNSQSGKGRITKKIEYIKNEDAEKIINTAITEGYEQAQQLLNDLNEEDAEGLDMDDDDLFNW